MYQEADFNKIIEIKEREADRVKQFLNDINQNEKTIVFCATQDHAAAVRDLINQNKKSTDHNYCVRVTANDGEMGEAYLRTFQDNEKTIPTILTTSQKLSTGVDALNIRNIVLMRPINSMIEFKQIIGRGTRLFDGKEFFTIYDFVNAHHRFLDPEWDGEPVDLIGETNERSEEGNDVTNDQPSENEIDETPETERRQKLKIKLADGKEREIQQMVSTLYLGADGKPMTAKEFLESLYGKLSEFFKNEDELRKIWSDPNTRKDLLHKLENVGFERDKLLALQNSIDADNSDLFDVLEYISFSVRPISRDRRVAMAQAKIFSSLNNNEKEFVEFVLSKYIESGVEELDEEKFPKLIELKYHTFHDAMESLGDLNNIKKTFMHFQQYLYEQRVM